MGLDYELAKNRTWDNQMRDMQRADKKREISDSGERQAVELFRDQTCEVLFLGQERGKKTFKVSITETGLWKLRETFARIVKCVPNREMEVLESLNTLAEILLVTWEKHGNSQEKAD